MGTRVGQVTEVTNDGILGEFVSLRTSKIFLLQLHALLELRPILQDDIRRRYSNLPTREEFRL